MRDFLKKSRPQPEKCGLLQVIFWKKKWPYILEKGTFMHDFLKNVDLDPKNINRYASFSEKSAPLSEKCGRFTHDFLKNVDLYVHFFEKSGP